MRNKRGTEIPIGRKAFENLIQHEEVKAEPPKAEIEETDDIRIIDGEVFYKDKGLQQQKLDMHGFLIGSHDLAAQRRV